MGTAGQSALGPYRVLDLADESGVFCTKVLAALGADVIKVEPPGGDPSRGIGPFYHDDPDPEKSLHWFTYNLNKRSITLNLECATGQALFKRLVKTADFLVESFRPGYLGSLGLAFSDLSAINPGLIQTSITPYGSTGPYTRFKGSNLTCLAMSGFLYTIGDPDRPPVQVATPVAYLEAGLHAAAATMVAFWYRQRTGHGQHVDLAAREAIMAQFVSPGGMLWKTRQAVVSRGITGATVPGRPDTRGISMCQDGYVLYNTTYAHGRRPLREWLASEGMAGDLFDSKWDPIFLQGAPVTIEMKEHIDALFRAFALKHKRDDLMREAQRRGVQVAKEHTVSDVMEDAHLKERGYFVKVEHPELHDAITYAGAPFKSAEMSWQYFRRAPFIGEHNGEIYCGELGLSQQDVAALKEGGAI